MKNYNVNIKHLLSASLFVAIGVVLPIAFHFVGFGSKLLPMQLPVLLAGYFLSPPYSAVVGITTPIISTFATGMPPFFPNMPCLAVEFGAYGLFLGIYKFKSRYLRLVTALISGKAVLFLFALSNPAFLTFASAQLVNGFAGMLIQIAAVPFIVTACERSKHHVLQKK
jgi:predicted membrane protein